MKSVEQTHGVEIVYGVFLVSICGATVRQLVMTTMAKRRLCAIHTRKRPAVVCFGINFCFARSLFHPIATLRRLQQLLLDACNELAHHAFTRGTDTFRQNIAV